MIKNVGPREKYVRLGTGVAALALLPFVGSVVGKVLLGITAVSGIGTGASNYCPINQALGRNAPKEIPEKRAA